MTPEVMKFWLDIFHSPVALTLAGALLGAVSTLVGVWLKSRHDAKENQKAWERQEITRKEERLFSLKTGAYNDFAKLFISNPVTGLEAMGNNMIAVSIELSNYGSIPVKHEIKKFFTIANEWRIEQSEEKSYTGQSC
uniref:hypothetical protein n=1 Tax=uncultured Bilophila sp. TaxID=529385 RepID=UPI0025EB2630|nr:hypothetical protein [uncultured Bilophila sp.]